MSGAQSGEMIVVADTHLTRRDAELDLFTDFLARRGGEAGTVVHLGDLFNIWLGRPRFQMEHMGPVLDAFRALRRRGVGTILVEGNRDFHARRWYRGDAFDEVVETETEMTVGPIRVRLAHGDLVNVHDRQYRLWRRFSKSTPVRLAVGLLPSGVGIRLAERLESTLRGTNIRHKSHFPVGPAQEYGETAVARGCDLLLLGHFHEERVMDLGGGGGDPARGERARALIALPDWRSSHRYVRVGPDGSWRLENWECSR